jgi:regulator of sigma E protease
MEFILTIFIGIAVLGLLIFVHEAGHFFAAKFFGVKVEEFGFGFPIPGRIWGVKKGETTYSINWLPAGGFVRLLGEEGEEDDPRSFSNKPWWQRALIVAAGVIVNLIVGIILFTILLSFTGFKADFPLLFENKFPFGRQQNYTFISQVEEGSPAKEAGLKAGDKILTADNKTFETSSSFVNYIKEHKGQTVKLVVLNINDQKERTVNVVPSLTRTAEQGALGVNIGEEATVSYDSLAEKVFSGVLHSANLLEFQWVGIKTLFSQSIAEKSISPIASNSSGPVGIVAVFSVILNIGGIQALIILINLTALISLILGIANILPIPAMDGGRLFFIVLEGIRGKKVSLSLENKIHTYGLMVLIVLFVLITFNDIFKILTGRIFG